MKTLIAVMMGVILSGCGKASVTFTTPGGSSTTVSVDTSGLSPVQTAQADIATCPVGMTLYPTTVGQSAFCIDNVPNGSKIAHSDAVIGCVGQGKELCSIPQLMRACNAGGTPTGVMYWSRTMSGANNYAGTFVFDPTACSGVNGFVDLATAYTAQSFCCAD